VRFGSRVDLWVPQQAEILVKVGQHVKGGSSLLASWPALKNNPVAVRGAFADINPVVTGKRS
ncbi:MAG TPA: hypothetical protein VGO27_04720, partial [Candidatus Acidoferrum sp.]|nr:hypothetical protein [Candidatus Acidoferrum sp.]